MLCQFSLCRLRGSLGALCEAWARAGGENFRRVSPAFNFPVSQLSLLPCPRCILKLRSTSCRCSRRRTQSSKRCTLRRTRAIRRRRGISSGSTPRAKSTGSNSPSSRTASLLENRCVAVPESLNPAPNLEKRGFPDFSLLTRCAVQEATWYPDATLNTCYNAIDRHVLAGFGERVCFNFHSAYPAAAAVATRSITYEEMLWDVQVLAGVLRHKLNVKKGDRVVIYFPNSIEGAVSMLSVNISIIYSIPRLSPATKRVRTILIFLGCNRACARIGAIHSTVFGGFAPKELAKRIEDAQPVAILASSCGLEPNKVIDYKCAFQLSRSLPAIALDAADISTTRQHSSTKLSLTPRTNVLSSSSDERRLLDTLCRSSAPPARNTIGIRR